MRTSELRTLVEFQVKNKTTDEFGTTVERWTLQTKFKCKMVGNSGRMTEQNNEKFYSNNLIIECYYRIAVTEGMRAIINGITYMVDSITPTPFKNYMELHLIKINL